MFRFSFGRIRQVLLMAFVLSAATPALAGPPWISIEVPGNPYEEGARDAFLVVHAFHHMSPDDAPLTGVAEGTVNGRRRTIPLSFQKMSRVGAFGVKKQWPDSGVWVLAFTVTEHGNAEASALVSVGEDGQVAKVQTFGARQANGYVMPRAYAKSDVDAALHEMQVRAVALRGLR
jgi:hypothetical protein